MILLPFSSSRKCEQPTFWLQVSMTFSYVKWPDYLRCGMIWKMWIKSTKPLANDSGQYLFAAVNIRKYSPANVGMAHSNQRNFLEHSEEPYDKYRYLRLIPNLQLTPAGRTGTANGPQIALGPHFAQVWSIVCALAHSLPLTLPLSPLSV